MQIPRFGAIRLGEMKPGVQLFYANDPTNTSIRVQSVQPYPKGREPQEGSQEFFLNFTNSDGLPGGQIFLAPSADPEAVVDTFDLAEIQHHPV